MRAVVMALALALALAGCAAPEVRYETVPASLIPAPPVLPTVKSEQLQCLSDDAYEALAKRDLLRRQYERELRALLGSGRADD